MKNQRLIQILSIAIPAAVAVLLNPRFPHFSLGAWTKMLPHVNGVINTLTSLCLVTGFYFIKQKNIVAHRRVMMTAFSLGALFLVSYVLYHLSNDETKFLGTGLIRPLYYFLLVSHIVLSIVVVWLVLRSLNFALNQEFEAHKKINRWAFPIWLYVSVTGVIIYLMISPYYV
jgi:putative membrane protein